MTTIERLVERSSMSLMDWQLSFWPNVMTAEKLCTSFSKAFNDFFDFRLVGLPLDYQTILLTEGEAIFSPKRVRFQWFTTRRVLGCLCLHREWILHQRWGRKWVVIIGIGFSLHSCSPSFQLLCTFFQDLSIHHVMVMTRRYQHSNIVRSRRNRWSSMIRVIVLIVDVDLNGSLQHNVNEQL